MTLSEELTWRGFVNQTTFKDITELDKAPLTFYWGVDPSAASMTVGNLAMAMMVRHFINHGHKAILLVGGATGVIGDPDGKAQERNLKSLEEIAKNKAGITAQYRQIFAGQDFEIVDNYDWFKEINYLDFLRSVGKHLSMTQLLDREFVQSRIGKGGAGISYAEFSYSLIQGYDFLHLFREKGATLQVAGADQWGNSLSGVELIRKLEGKESHVWTGPLVVNKSTGIKFGKSEAGAVWVDAEQTSVFDYYQFWLNSDDAGVIEYMKFYTFLSKEEIDDYERQLKENPSERAAQKALAYEATKIVHGQEKADAAVEATKQLFAGGGSELTPTVTIEPGTYAVAELVVKAGLATSNSEARRLFEQGGIKLNQQKVSEPEVTVASGDLLQVGKRKFAKIA
ncbi:MAG TPA: tyrosine--tRNA ligase [Candidatus Saccharimonadales bacterium]|nr:tyrosine--tRNA ligase [Candidatus Saccharimonadales bacterium]